MNQAIEFACTRALSEFKQNQPQLNIFRKGMSYASHWLVSCSILAMDRIPMYMIESFHDNWNVT
jgi:hypothetical protein